MGKEDETSGLPKWVQYVLKKWEELESSKSEAHPGPSTEEDE